MLQGIFPHLFHRMNPLNATQRSILKQLEENHRGFFTKAKSFYIHGKTGCGKTTILENFVAENCDNNKVQKKILYMHFHDYLLDITKLLHKNPLKKVAREISKNIDFLCFDEFFIESIADAKILYDIFFELIKSGVAVILTSNFAPDELYKDGFNRAIMFPQFSDFIREKMIVCHINNTPDYRTASDFTEYQICFNDILSFATTFQVTVTKREEQIFVDNNHITKISGRFQSELQSGCILDYNVFFKTHTSIKDFRKIARTFKHIHVENMQKFTQNNEDEAIRFRNFIDILYARGTIFSCSGLPALNLFEEKMLENIKFKRCESRLVEMETFEYIFAKNKEIKRTMTISSAKFFEDIASKLA